MVVDHLLESEPMRIGTCLILTLASFANAQTAIHGKGGIELPAAPLVEKHPVTDTYQIVNGQQVTVTDNFRYLEDARAPATRAYIATENAYTQSYLDQVKILPEVRTQMAALLRVDQMSVPTRRGDKFFFSRRLAQENQSSIYMRTGLHGVDTKLIDGNTRSADGNTSVNMQGISQDGSILIYGVRIGGADESEVHFFDVKTGIDTGDVLPSARYYGVQIAPDKKGVYYSRFFPHEGCRVFYHAFGTPVGEGSDAMLLGRSYKGEALNEIDGIGVRITENGHFLVMSIGRGVPAKREDILLKDLRVKDAPIIPLVYGYDSRFEELSVGDQFFVDTDFGAPNHRVLKVALGQKPEQWVMVLPEGKDVIESVSLVS
jgi:prolyl oligopeptidase